VQRNHYQVLKLATNASQEEIKAAYKKLALENHPDKNAGNKEKEEEFKKIAEAYGVLSDEDQKVKYDLLQGMVPMYRVVNSSPFFTAQAEMPSFTVCFPTLAILRTSYPIDPDSPIKMALLGSKSAAIDKFLRYAWNDPSDQLSFAMDSFKEQYTMNVWPTSCLNGISLILIFNQQSNYLKKIQACLRDDPDTCQVIRLNCSLSKCDVTNDGTLAAFDDGVYMSSSSEQHESSASQCMSQLFLALETRLMQVIPKEVMEERIIRLQAARNDGADKEDALESSNCCRF